MAFLNARWVCLTISALQESFAWKEATTAEVNTRHHPSFICIFVRHGQRAS
jgi:hypothetical protein